MSSTALIKIKIKGSDEKLKYCLNSGSSWNHISFCIFPSDTSEGNDILTKATVPIYATGVLTCYNQVTNQKITARCFFVLTKLKRALTLIIKVTAYGAFLPCASYSM